jgi:formate-dependent phosphoribosylglycinamide formyltransferase (GAR transformylase)
MRSCSLVAMGAAVVAAGASSAACTRRESVRHLRTQRLGWRAAWHQFVEHAAALHFSGPSCVSGEVQLQAKGRTKLAAMSTETRAYSCGRIGTQRS